MSKSISNPVRVLWIVLTLGVPALLLSSAARTYRTLRDQTTVYLRSRIAAVADRLETMPAGLTGEQVVQAFDDDPGLAGLSILTRTPGDEKEALTPLWEGRELFRTEPATVRGERVLRAYVPFHNQGELRLARIDMAEAAADFLVEPARNHLWATSMGALLIVVLSIFTAWNFTRAANAERRQLELEHLAHIGKMSAVLAHEIRNPLGTIKGFAQLLGEKLPSREAELLKPILSETSRLERLVNDLLLYGRPSLPQFQPVDSTTLAEALRAHAERSDGRGETRFEFTVPAVTFETDPNLLEQALLNLVRNSIEAVRGQHGGEVRLEMDRNTEGLRWKVLDNGPGFSEEARKRLFEPFYTSKALGTGLGLSITRKAVEALGGTLRAGNRLEGGAEVEIRLPARAPARVIRTHGTNSGR